MVKEARARKQFSTAPSRQYRGRYSSKTGSCKGGIVGDVVTVIIIKVLAFNVFCSKCEKNDNYRKGL